MAKIRDDWPEEYIEKIEAIESKLDREICGVPTGSGGPCQKWPISKDHGRCREHLPPRNDSFSETFSSEEKKTVKEVGSSSNSSSSPLSWQIFLILTLVGLLVGMGGTAAWIYFNKDRLTSGNASLRTSQSGSDLQVNPDDPDFTRLRELLNDGKFDRVVVGLQQIVNQTSRQSIRAEANYRLYVLYQRVDEFNLALKIARKFIDKFPESRRAPEVLYGAGNICKQYLNDSDRAQKFYKFLKERYPDSKWAQKV